MGKKAEKALPALVKATGDENRGVREDSAYALGYIGGNRGKPEIIRVLKKMVPDENPGVRRAAVRSLFRASVKPVPDDVIDTLAGALDDEHWSVRKAAAQALGHAGEQAKSTVPLLQKLLKDPEERVRKAAGNALKLITNGK
jgi:HEAT repeat protein